MEKASQWRLCSFTAHLIYRSIITLIISDRFDLRDARGKWPLARNPDRSWWHRHTNWKFFWPQPMAPWTAWYIRVVKPSRWRWAGSLQGKYLWESLGIDGITVLEWILRFRLIGGNWLTRPVIEIIGGPFWMLLDYPRSINHGVSSLLFLLLLLSSYGIDLPIGIRK